MYRNCGKKIFDFTLAFILLVLLLPLIFFLIILSSFDTKTFGIFTQKRVGQFGSPFIILKLKTINPRNKSISRIGAFLRKNKLDEFPQLINIIRGEMSFVGPRPDISGYYDKLPVEYQEILSLKPGLTSAAGIKYKNEEELLRNMANPMKYNDEVLFPDKIKMNLEYCQKQSFILDVKIIWKTFISFLVKLPVVSLQIF